MSLYGISPNDLSFIQNKIDKQKDFLESNSFQTMNGEFKTYREISMSANISSRYYAQLANKVNTLQEIMTNENLMPVFLTISLDGWLQRLIYGDYSKFNKMKKDKQKKCLKSVPKYLREKIKNREFLTIGELYKILRYQWTEFQKSRTYSDRKSDGFNIGYLFSVEPHKSGVPHAHVLMYIPEQYKLDFKKEFLNKCPAPRNKAQTRKKHPYDKEGLTSQQIANGECNGFQWTLNNPVGYVMKYCTKSFLDIKNNSELDELQAWYMKHKIRRISMSHTLVPQWVYNKIYPLEDSWHYLTDLKINSFCEWSKEDDYFKFTDSYKDQVLRYEKGLYQRFLGGELKEEFGTKKEIIPNSIKINDIDFIPFAFSKVGVNCYTKSYMNHKLNKSLKQKRHHDKAFNELSKKEKIEYIWDKNKKLNKKYKPLQSIKIVIDGFEKDLYPIQKPIPEQTDLELLNEYNYFDFDNGNMQRYTYLRNNLIKRGLVKGKIESLNITDIFDEQKSLFSLTAPAEHNLIISKKQRYRLDKQNIDFLLNVKNTQFEVSNKINIDLFTKEFHKQKEQTIQDNRAKQVKRFWNLNWLTKNPIKKVFYKRIPRQTNIFEYIGA